ncbi:enoyl-CoA hydratase/isomerase family protein [Acidiphilium sp. PA]|uniref:enoyl-CoA hydratase/isomerase family protein n=1 Tax=Acidiphilium sp. PA TaxID=2871705 RepID=UPI002243155A|nr:enoyl-CoA hydratase/isomerase family protein [Acidiphilium sp. PA]MCW8307593.1 enoyl-CoA hydratase/isomerase family protein [Acidiphilium sp. PA]
MNDPIDFRIDGHGIATITLDRAELHNAFDDAMITGLLDILGKVATDAEIGLVVLQGRGRSFSAGADLNWMRRSAAYTPEQNLADAQDLARLMHALHTMPKPTLALVQGAVFGGGVGLVACCDIALATSDAKFSFSEVRLGLIPAVISPYVIAAIGPRQARRYFQTGEIFTAETAHRIGLVHEVVAPDALPATRDALIAALQRGGPQAKASAKALIAEVADRPIDRALIVRTAQLISEHRASAEGREGLAAFLEKRAPSWLID